MAKFSQLEVGQKWAMSASYQGLSDVPWSADCVVVLDVQPHYKHKYRWETKYLPADKDNRGMYIKVDLVGQNRQDFVYIKHLFMLWDEYRTRLDKQVEVSKENQRLVIEKEVYRQEVFMPKVNELVDLLSAISGVQTGAFQYARLEEPHIDVMLKALKTVFVELENLKGKKVECEKCNALAWEDDLLPLHYGGTLSNVCGTCYDKYVEDDGRRKPYDQE
jgi:hypothetical protein